MRNNNHIHSDKSVSQKTEDAFQRYSFAERISNLISSYQKEDSFVIGMYGKWGEGKSSVLNFIQIELADKDDIIVVNFNPWLFSGEAQLLLSFFQVLAASLDKKLKSKKEQLGEMLRDYAGALGVVGTFVGLPNGKDIFEAVGKKLTGKSVDDYKSTISKALADSGKKVLVVIDDIDRLSIDEVQTIFKLIKIAADFKNTIYLLSFDDELVASSLDPKYAMGGRDYLEKIVQLPLKLPKAQQFAIKRYTLKVLNDVVSAYDVKLEEDEVHRFVEFLDKMLLPSIQNPRVATRFANSIYFAVPLLKGEVNMVDLLILEGIKVIHPSLYDFIRSNHSLLTQSYESGFGDYRESQSKKEAAKGKITAHLKAMNYSVEETLPMLQKLFPQLKSVFGNISYPERKWQDWYKNKRLCSGRYINRYFTYTVIEGEISDVYFDELLEKLAKEDYIGKEEELYQLLQDLEADEVAIRLLFLEDTFDNNYRYNLAKNIALLGEYFPDVKDVFSFTGPFNQMVGFMKKAVTGLSAPKRLAAASSLILRAEPLNFAIALWYKLDPREKESQFSDTEYQLLSTELYKRCRLGKNLEELLTDLEDSDLRFILNIGAGLDSTQTKGEVKGLIDGDNQNFIKILHAYSQTTISKSLGAKNSKSKEFKSAFNESYYEELQDIVDIDSFYKKSLQLYGDQSSFEPKSGREELTDEQLVGWFQKIHLEKSSLH
ncbi:hypothetical protein H9Q13_16640 [Pontibacter sp. JH31]|uniref:KAP NTPase domain-containing protein n=1 Tax=Pontibacter aquaedesilientis TaxID=2766980 RepID=A0ABR7XKK6_9BACT|nr:P-loop NTPase fold protein [Pontibacter aquaedesilientis]MBD1398802.1 hypothetical protein [Pontibacter aquaedesilientis]